MPSQQSAEKSEARATPAQTYLVERQRKFPPCYQRRNGLDRGQQLCRTLEPGLPPELRALLADGTVAVGEVGRFEPDVRAIPIAGGGFAIEFSTGMMDFDYAVGRALAGVHIEHTQAGPVNKTALKLPGVVELVGGVYREWRKHTRWAGLRRSLWLFGPLKRIKHAEFAIAPGPREWIDDLVTTAEAFMLAHELGHVALDRGLVPPITANDEENADSYGLKFFLAAYEQKGSPRFAYAAVIFAIRLFAGLERLPGVNFGAAYPPQAKRVELLRDQILARHPSRQYFHEAATIMVAYQDIMDDVDEYIFKGAPAVPADADRVLVRLISELEEVARGRVEQGTFVDDMAKIEQSTPADMLKQAAVTLVGYYLPPSRQDSFLPFDRRVLMAAALVRLVMALPPHLQKLFPIPNPPAPAPAASP